MPGKVFNLQTKILVFAASIFACFIQGNIESALGKTGGKSDSRLLLNIKKTHYDSSIGLNWKIFWDFNDLARVNLKNFGIPLSNWDITKNTRLSVYGFSVNPWEFVLKEEKQETGGLAGGKNEQSRKGAENKTRKKIRFSLYPLYRNFREEMPEKIREIIIENSLSTLPGWKSAGREAKKAFIKDILSLNEIWKAPLLNKTKRETEKYLQEEFKEKEIPSPITLPKDSK